MAGPFVPARQMVIIYGQEFVKIKFPEIYVLQELTLCSSVQNAIVFLAGLQFLSWSFSPPPPGPLPPLPPRSLLTTIQPLHASVAVLASNTFINQADSLNISLLALYLKARSENYIFAALNVPLFHLVVENYYQKTT